MNGALRSDRLAGAGYVLLALLFYAPLLLGRYTFPDGDFTHHFLPFRVFQRYELLAGRLPIWNPYTYAGHPFLADVQSAVFYPISNLLLLISLPWESIAAQLYWLQLEAPIHVALAGIFTYLLLRDLTGVRPAAFLAGAAFAFSGYLTGYPPLQLAVLRTAVWLPLILWLLWRAFAALSGTTWRWWIGAAAAYTVALLAGHPQTFFFLSHVVAGWIVFLLLTTWRRSGRTQRLVRVAGFALISLGLSAVQLWPSWEFTRLSVRANAEYAFLSGGFPIDDTWQMLLPGVLTQFSPLYVGVVGLGLALVSLVALFAGSESDRGEAPASAPAAIGFFVVVTVFFLLVSYGENGPLYRVLYEADVPGWRLFRGQERAAYVVAFGMSVLAGYGAALLSELHVRARRLMGLGLVLLALAGAAGYGLFWQSVGRTDSNWPEFYMVAGSSVLFALLFAAILWARSIDHRHVLALAAVLLLDLFVTNAATNLVPGTSADRVATAPEITALVGALKSPSTANQGIPGRVYNEYRVYLDYGMIHGVEEVWGSSPLRLAHYAALFEEFPLDRMWRLTGVEHTLTWRRELFEPSDLLAEFPQGEDTTYLHRLVESNPRAWIVTETRAADDATALQLLADHSFDLEMTAVVPASEESRTLAPAGQNTIEIRRLAPNRLHLDVQSERGGLLVISENWMPGWRAVDADTGEVLPLVQTNLSFLGVELSAGERSVELQYFPHSIRYGLLITGITVLILVVGAAYFARRSAR